MGASAMNLKEAFNALSNIPNINVRQPDYNLPGDFLGPLKNVQVAGAYNLNQQQIGQTGNVAFTLLNQVPLTYMINGGNNGFVGAFIYAEPSTPTLQTANLSTPQDIAYDTTTTYDILIVVFNGSRGTVTSIYGTTDAATVNAINQAPVTIEGNTLTLESQLPDGDFNIILNKAR